MRSLKTLSCKVPTPVHERLTRIADAEGNQVSAVIRRILIAGIPQAERDAPQPVTTQVIERAKRARA